MPGRVPFSIEQRVVTRLYADAEARDWDVLTARERSERYVAWLEDPEIGRVLAGFMPIEGVRVWLKDGPMKEYARAKAGQGRYAACLSVGPIGTIEVIRLALGDDWQMVPGTQGVKPLRCVARNAHSDVELYWGPATSFKHLLWAALQNVDDSTKPAPRVIVLETMSKPTSTAMKAKCTRIAARCKVDLVFLATRD